jgi:VanZ family protein
MLSWAVLALVIAAGYSALDEFHQSFVPSRTASPWDSLLDTFGAAAAQVVMWAIARRHAASTPRYATVAPKVPEPVNK